MTPETWDRLETKIDRRRRRLLAELVRFSARAIVEDSVSPSRIFAAVDSLAHPLRSRRTLRKTRRDIASDAADDLADALAQVRRIIEQAEDTPSVRRVRREAIRCERTIGRIVDESVASDAKLERLFHGEEV